MEPLSSWDRLTLCANFSVVIARSDKYTKVFLPGIKIFRDDLQTLIQSNDTPLIVAPTPVQVGRKREPGLLLLLHDRFVILWATGTFRVATHHSEAPYTSVTDVEELGQDDLRITAGSTTYALSGFDISGHLFRSHIANILRSKFEFALDGGQNLRELSVAELTTAPGDAPVPCAYRVEWGRDEAGVVRLTNLEVTL